MAGPNTNSTLFYYPSGRISEKASYWHGEVQGEVVDYNEDGTVRESHYYKDGKPSATT